MTFEETSASVFVHIKNVTLFDGLNLVLVCGDILSVID